MLGLNTLWATMNIGQSGRSINYNTILQLDIFCRKEGKWAEVPLCRDHPELLKGDKIDT
jgi:hypothetical protein